MKGQLAFSSTLSCTSRLNSRLSVVTDLELLELCIKDTEHRFYREMLINAMQTETFYYLSGP